jgi:virginiamycin B lyase
VATAELELTAFATGSGRLPLLTPGPDGEMWFAADASSGPLPWSLDRITSGGVATTVRLAGSFFRESADRSLWWFVGITAGPDGNTWATEIYDDPETIALVTRTGPDGSVAAFSIDGTRQLGGIAAGPDHNVWFTEMGADARIGCITPAGRLTHFSLGSAWSSAGARAGSIASGPDGHLWFAASTAHVGRLTVDGELTDFPLLAASDTAEVIVAGADGNLWFRGTSGEGAGGTVEVIGRVTPQGCITEFRFALANGAAADGLAADDAGNLWFAAGDEIARFDPSGTIAEYILPGASSEPCLVGEPGCGPPHADAIALGSDGHIWFTESYGSGATYVMRIDGIR